MGGGTMVGGAAGLNGAQYKILKGAIEVSEKKMENAMQHWDKVNYVLDLDTVVNADEIAKIR